MHALFLLLQEDVWANYMEEREWMADFSYKREGEDCPRGSRGASVLDFETPSVSVCCTGLVLVVCGLLRGGRLPPRTST